MKRVFICSPYRKNEFHGVYYNHHIAILACRYAISQGYAPYAPHLYLPMCLNDRDEDQRWTALDIGREFIFVCEELWQIGDYVSEGMQLEIELAEDLKRKIRYIDTERLKVRL